MLGLQPTTDLAHDHLRVRAHQKVRDAAIQRDLQSDVECAVLRLGVGAAWAQVLSVFGEGCAVERLVNALNGTRKAAAAVKDATGAAMTIGIVFRGTVAEQQEETFTSSERVSTALICFTSLVLLLRRSVRMGVACAIGGRVGAT